MSSFVLAIVPVAGVALVVAIMIGGALTCVAAATIARGRVSGPRLARATDGPSIFAGLGAQRLAIAGAAGFVVLLLTQWLFLALAAAVLTAVWGRLLRDQRADDERRRIEGIAKWLEDLRDTLRGSSVGAEEALEHVAARPPAAIREPLATFVFRRRQGFRTEDALTDLADGLAHPTSDAAIAAIRLVVSGTAGAGRLYRTVSALAAAARDEVRARERVDRTRSVYQASMKRLVIIAALLIVYLRLAAGNLLDPYSTAGGQLFLAVPLAMWAGCVMWLRSLCRYELPQRYRIVGSRS
jgi:tight adherence protein B